MARHKDKFTPHQPVKVEYGVKNTFRAIGTRLSHYVHKNLEIIN